MKKLLLLLGYSISISGLYAQGWGEFGVGLAGLNANGQIISVVSDNTGAVYASGAFVLSGERNVYKWGSTHWEQLGNLNANGWFAAMCLDAANNLYVAGDFNNSFGNRYVAKWNGTSWGQVGTGANMLLADSTVWTICMGNAGNIFAAGDFRNSTGYNYVARWNGSTWSEAGAGFGALNANGRINKICSDPLGNVYAAGYFNEGTAKYFVARWDHSLNTWTKIGSYFNGPVLSLCAGNDGTIYSGGGFTDNNGYAYVARWDGIVWNQTGIGANAMNVPGIIFDISAGKNGNVFAGGTFQNTLGFRYVAYWNGIKWGELGDTTTRLNANSSIFTIFADTISGNVYAAGDFTNDNGKYYVAKYKMPSTSDIEDVAVTERISIYPNPANGKINIEAKNIDAEHLVISITDIAGKILLHQNVEYNNRHISAVLNIKALFPGMYFVTLKTETRQYVTKIVKQ